MSGFSDDISNTGGPGSSAEPSMEEILASIRRILKEDDATPGAADDAIEDDVLLLDASMLARPADLSSATALPPEPEPLIASPEPAVDVSSYHEALHLSSEPAFSAQDFERADTSFSLPAEPEPQSQQKQEEPMEENLQPPHRLLSEDASDAAASSIGALVRSISADRSVAVSRGGITIEDIVREEIRPVLKAWLDTHLPSLVERIVRAEIARVVERGVG